MYRFLKDMGFGLIQWVIGALILMIVYFSPLPIAVWSPVVLILFIPSAIWITSWWFQQWEPASLMYYAGLGVAWALIAIVLDYLFIVPLFGATYYAPDVYLYYALTFLIPVGVGGSLIRRNGQELETPVV